MELIVEDGEDLVAATTEHALNLYTMLLLRPGTTFQVHG